MAFMVTRRSREIGIRNGARGADGERGVAGDAGGAGARRGRYRAGLPAALALSGLVRAQLYGIAGSDPVSIVVA